MGDDEHQTAAEQSDGGDGAVWKRLTDEPHLRGVEVSFGDLDPSWPFSFTVWAMEFLREEPLESEVRRAIDTAVRTVPGVADVIEEDREVWLVQGDPLGESLLQAIAGVIDSKADEIRSVAFRERTGPEEAEAAGMLRIANAELVQRDRVLYCAIERPEVLSRLFESTSRRGFSGYGENWFFHFSVLTNSDDGEELSEVVTRIEEGLREAQVDDESRRPELQARIRRTSMLVGLRANEPLETGSGQLAQLEVLARDLDAVISGPAGVSWFDNDGRSVSVGVTS